MTVFVKTSIVDLWHGSEYSFRKYFIGFEFPLLLKEIGAKFDEGRTSLREIRSKKGILEADFDSWRTER